jgi:hypothetical protein
VVVTGRLDQLCWEADQTFRSKAETLAEDIRAVSDSPRSAHLEIRSRAENETEGAAPAI